MWSSSPACTWHCSLHYLFLQATPLFRHAVTTTRCFLFTMPKLRGKLSSNKKSGCDGVIAPLCRLSSIILTDSSTGSPVHVLMLSLQAVHGLPRLRAPDNVPCFISFPAPLPTDGSFVYKAVSVYSGGWRRGVVVSGVRQ